MALRNPEGELEVSFLDAASKLTRRDILATTLDDTDSVEAFWLTMGDIDGDTGLYTQRSHLPMVYRQ